MPKSILWSACLLFIMCCAYHAAWAQALPEQLFFKRISSDKGLSQPTVNGICRDSTGFVWFATEDGLNRYDGNEFRVYRHIPGDSTSLSHNVVHFVHEDARGNLWVGTVDGLNYFDRTTERFTAFNAPQRPGTIYLNAATDEKRKRLWLAAGIGGLRYLDRNTRIIKDAEYPGLTNDIVWTIAQTGDTIFIGTLGKGLRALDLNTKRLTTVGDSTADIRSILVTKDAVWFGTEGKGLGRLDRKSHHIQYYTQQNQTLNNNNIWALAEDSVRNLWIGTDGGGLNILPPGSTTARTILHSEFDERSISANTIRCIYLEPNGQAWLGTYNGGVSYYSLNPVHFQLYKKEFGNEQSLLNNSVTAFTEDANGTLWVGTDGGGLHYFKDGVVHRFPLPPPFQKVKVIISLLADETGLWIGTFRDGLIHRDPKGRWHQFLNIPGNKKSLSDNIVWTLARDTEGYLWIGTDHGINRYDAATKTFHNLNNPLPGNIGAIFSNTQVQALCIGRNHTLWIGSYGMLTAYLPTDSVIEIRSSLPGVRNLRVKALVENNDAIWIGTYGNGLCHYNTRSHKLTALDEPDGLPNNVILSIEKETNGNLWFSTNKGLVHFDVHDTLFTTFDANYGVQGVVFNRGASMRTRDGRFVFGGTKGFNIFKPDAFRYDLSALSIAFTDFQIANRSVRPGSALMPQSITGIHTISLPYSESRLISFTFSSLYFVAPENILYSYKLANFDSLWLPSKAHSVTFTNLDPGTYTLHVRASYNGRTWGPDRTLRIVIKTPWWQSRFFRTSMLLLAIVLTYALYRYRVHRLHVGKKELEHLVDEQSREIKSQNNHLATQNEELIQQNEEVMAQKETISAQNVMLHETKQKLQEINESLELQVHQRTEKLNETIAQLNKTIKELDAFVYSASHDLVAPLKSVLGLVDLARRENPDEGLTLYLNHIEISVRKLENVILNMIQYSRNTRLEVTYEEVNIQSLLQECIADVRFMPGADEVAIHTNIPPDHIVRSDPRRLKIIFGNLISNAIKYRDTRKDARLIQIQLEKGKTVWTLEIADNGIGIDKKYLSRVFEMFFRATDRAQGSGLGLYIVEETVARLYGEIHVDSELGEWTKFVVTIPNDEGYRRHK